MSSMYLPGRGMVNLAARRLDAAVREHDPRLLFARHPQTEQWTVFIKIERDLDPNFGTEVAGQRVFPVREFQGQPEDIHKHDVIEWLQKADTLNRNSNMLEEMHKHNEKLREPARRLAEEADGIMAETIESYKRNTGQTRFTRVDMNRPAGRNYAIKGE